MIGLDHCHCFILILILAYNPSESGLLLGCVVDKPQEQVLTSPFLASIEARAGMFGSLAKLNWLGRHRGDRSRKELLTLGAGQDACPPSNRNGIYYTWCGKGANRLDCPTVRSAACLMIRLLIIERTL